jgi:hypothetical protein
MKTRRLAESPPPEGARTSSLSLATASASWDAIDNAPELLAGPYRDSDKGSQNRPGAKRPHSAG